jgi:holo-[acyl-carrier protein] synthase
VSRDADVMESRIALLANEALSHLDIAIGVRPDEGDAPGETTTSLRVGVDIAEVADIAASVDNLGERYLERLFTPHELSVCRSTQSGLPAWSAESLAARFAAKEAVVKVLRPTGVRPDWRNIEIHRSEAGWCEVRLFGRARDQAGEAGITELAVSLTHEGALAAAVVVALCSTTDGASGPVVESNGRKV